MSADTPTPETDAHIWFTPGHSEVVYSMFARRIERERDAARARVAELEAKIARLSEPNQLNGNWNV